LGYRRILGSQFTGTDDSGEVGGGKKRGTKRETDRQKRYLRIRIIQYNLPGLWIGYPKTQIRLLSTMVSLIPLVIFLPT